MCDITRAHTYCQLCLWENENYASKLLEEIKVILQPTFEGLFPAILYSQRRTVLTCELVTVSRTSQILAADTSVFCFTETQWRYSILKIPYIKEPLERKSMHKNRYFLMWNKYIFLRFPHHENIMPFGCQHHLRITKFCYYTILAQFLPYAQT